MAATIGSSALSTARPSGSSASTISPLAAPITSRLPNSPRCAEPTLSTTLTSGGAIRQRVATCPIPRAPISSTRKRVSSVARRIVSGSPTSVLKDPAGATVGPRSSSRVAIRSLVVVLPDEPVIATTLAAGSWSSVWLANRPRASTGSPGTTMVGWPVGRVPRVTTAPAAWAAAAKSWPSTRSPTIAT